MKKLLYSLLTLAAALTVASCQKEPVNASDPNFGGKPVAMTFDVNLGVATKAVTSSAFDDGKTVDKLYVAAYDAQGLLVSTSLVGDKAMSISDGAATVNLTLAKGADYTLVFFAMKDGKYTVNFADNNIATFAYTEGESYKANDAENDAFYAKIEVTNAASNAEAPIGVELKRPFAQINVFSSNRPSETATYSSTMTVKQVPTSFDLFAGAVGTTLADMTFADNAIAATSPNADYPYWLGMNYVLVPSAGKVDISFQENGMDNALSIDGIQIKENTRTNLVGALYSLDANLIYSVTINGGLDDETDNDVEAEYSVADNNTYTAESPLTINGTTASNFALTFNEGDKLSDVEGITATSDDPEIATATITGDNVVITPVSNGETTVHVTVPAYTKGAYNKTTFDIPVKVTGITVDPDLTVEGAPTEKVSEPFTLTVTTNSDGEISFVVAPEGAANVAASGTTTGTYTVTPATNLTEDTEVTVTFTVAATDNYNTKSEAATFTVAAAPQKTDQTLAFSATSDTATMGETYTLLTLTGAQTAVTYTSSNTEVATIEGTTVTLVAAGETTITATAAEDETYNKGTASYTLTVSEAETEPEEVTVSQFLSKDVSSNVWYKLTGKITEIVNNQYGNFYLQDNTGTVYVYGLTATRVTSNDKSFGTLGLRVNDEVTLIGTRAQYAGASVEAQKEQVGGPAYYVSHIAASYLEATPANKTVNATDTEVTWTITSNTDWTITPGEGVTASQTSGNGNAEVTLTFAANTTTDAKTLTATASATDCEDVTITITQNGAGTVSKVLTFDFTTEIEGWSSTAPTEATEWTYTIDDVEYVFKVNSQIKKNPKYLMLTSPAFLGLPTMEGYKLTRVVGYSNSGASTAGKVDIDSDTTGTIVTGGDTQTWSTASTAAAYTYELSGTSANTIYYFHSSNKNVQVSKLVLTFEK